MSSSPSPPTQSPNPFATPRDRAILDFMLLFAKRYLTSGGPTSRLEDCLTRIGSLYGRATEVFATPTGVFVTLSDPRSEEDAQTALTRIRETGTDLGQLNRLEQLFTDLTERRIELREARATLENPEFNRETYRSVHKVAAAFLAGVAISFQAYRHIGAALVSGLITALTWWVAKKVLQRRALNPIFTDFASAFFTLTLAACAHVFYAPLSVEAYALGGIVMLVPGLALTTAIAELAEQNLVSGTAKFMQATLAALALGLAYLLFQQLSVSLDLQSVLQPVTAKSSTQLLSVIALIVSLSCFGVIFRVPPHVLSWSTLTGLLGFAGFHAMVATRAAAAAPYTAAVLVGVASLTFGRAFRLPSQNFSVPGIVALLPGMLALNSIRHFAVGNPDTGVAFVFQVAVTAVSIVFGLMTARVPFLALTAYEESWPRERRQKPRS